MKFDPAALNPFKLPALIWNIAVRTYDGWFDNRLTSMAAAIAFYALFSLGPILVIAVAIAAPIVGHKLAEETVLAQIQTALGVENLETLQRVIQGGLFRGSGWIAGVFGVGVLIFSGTAMFAELDAALDVIWMRKNQRYIHPVLAYMRSRALALVLMIVIGVLMLAVILSTAALSAFHGVLSQFPIVGQYIEPLLGAGQTLLVTTLFFSAIYKFLPGSVVPWKYAVVSGAAVSGLFYLGNEAIAWYFAFTNLASLYGAAGALAAVMVWIYYSAIIVLLAGQVGRATRDAIEGRAKPPPPPMPLPAKEERDAVASAEADKP